MKIAVINGPNMNMLNKRNKDLYGKQSLNEINDELKEIANNKDYDLVFFQSNHEGEILDYIHSNYQEWNGLIINPAGLTTTSVSLRDALLLLNIPIMEVHLSNIYAREEFRQQSLLRDIVMGHICGLGAFGYKAALYYLIDKLDKGES
jgi:3-dehydroquinate dehydratase-2